MKKLKHLILAVFLIFSLSIPTVLFSAVKGDYEIVFPNIPPKEHSLDVVHIDEIFAFYCGYCNSLNNSLKQIKKDFGSKLKINPVPLGSPTTMPGKLVYVAMDFGKADEVKNILFDFYHYNLLGKEIFYNIDHLQAAANMAGINRDIKPLLDAPKIIKKMNDGLALAKSYEANTTPTLIIEGVIKTVGARPDNLIEIVNSLLKEPVKKFRYYKGKK